MMRPTAAAAPLIATWILLGLAADSATAATFVVDRVDDDPGAAVCDAAAAMDCSLRGAILRANLTPAFDSIQVPAGTYQLDPALGTLEIEFELAIEGFEGERPLIRTPATGWGEEPLLEAGAGAPLTLRRLVVEGGTNLSQIPGGTVSAPGALTLVDSEVRGGTSWGGGCIFAGGPTVIVYSTVRDCTLIEGPFSPRGGCVVTGSGGAVIEGTTISGCVSQSTNGRGGALYTGSLELRDSFVEGAVLESPSQGGAIASPSGSSDLVLIEWSVVVSGTADLGGGIFFGGIDRELVIRDSWVGGGTAVNGAGLHVDALGGVSATIERSSITHNHASGNGGAIYTVNGGEIAVVNSTLSGNSARHGSALDLHDGSALLIQSTLVEHPGALSLLRGGGIVVVASALAGTCVDPLTSSGDNFESPGNTCGLDAPTDHPSTPDLGLADLAFHATLEGAGSYAHLPLVGSPLLNAVAGACAVDHDQLGQPRPLTPFDPACDAGAIEGTGSPGIFIDGFESGSTWRWSTTVQ